MMNNPLIEAVKRLEIPEMSLRALMADYEDFLAANNPDGKRRLDERLGEIGFSEKMVEQTQASILASTLMVTLEPEVDFGELIKQAFPSADGDEDLLALRRELVSRALSMNKEVPALANLTRAEVLKRQELFCSAR